MFTYRFRKIAFYCVIALGIGLLVAAAAVPIGMWAEQAQKRVDWATQPE